MIVLPLPRPKTFQKNMRFPKLFFIIIPFLIFKIGFAINDSNHIIQNDTIEAKKIETKIFVYLEDLYDVEIKNNFFRAKMWYEISAPKDHPLFLDPILNNASDLVELKVLKEEFSEINETDSLNRSIVTLKGRFNHNWKVRNYPFDKPKLKLKFKSTIESKLISLDVNEDYYARVSERIDNLKDGFLIDSISFEKDFVINPKDTKIDNDEKLETLTFYINLKRQGSWLYLKLFLGSFLAFIISWLVFFIPKEEFGSRIDLSVGAIFGAVGNRAYVESIMPDIQVLTKADMINNAVIFLIIFNIIIFMIQRNKKIELKFFEDNYNASVYTAYIFIVINTFILLW